MFAWDELRFVLAVARHRNLRGAAAAIGVNHSTMFRRLNALERQIGSKLFERLPDGYRPTRSGVRLLETAERMETELLALDRELSGRDTRLTGELRVTASQSLAYGVLADEIARFNARHPGIVVELLVDDRVFDLSRREADVAFRAARPTQGDLFGRKLLDLRWRFYAAPSYLKLNPPPRRIADLAKHRLIGWSEGTQPTKAAAWLNKNVPASAISYRTGSPINHLMAAKAGLGLALLPCYLGEADDGVEAVMNPLPDLHTELWLVTHRSLKDTARVRAFMEIVGDGIRKALARRSR